MVKVRVLYPTAFEALGITEDEADVEPAIAEAFIAQGYAEPIKAKAAPKADEPAPVKRGPGRPKKA